MSEASKPQILVVDDDPSIRESLGMLLTSVGYDVIVAENGASAVSHLGRTVADLMVTDLNMPGMSGMDLISHVRSRYPATLIVAMSGYRVIDVKVSALGHGRLSVRTRTGYSVPSAPLTPASGTVGHDLHR